MNKKRKESIAVIFCTDNYYAVPTYISLYSLLKNYKGNAKIKAYIMTAEDFSEKNIQLLKALTELFEYVDIIIINMLDNYKDAKANGDYITIQTLYRLKIPRMLEEYSEQIVEKCLYLDSDVIVEGDITELFSIDIGDCYIGGVRDAILSNEEMTDFKKQLGIPSLQNYINAGVLLFNPKKILEDGKEKQLEEAAYKEDYRYNDQDIINSILYSGIKVLPIKYNFMTAYLYHNKRELIRKYGKSNLQDAMKNPLIVHYLSSTKPWTYRTSIRAEEWWKYANMQNDGVIQKYIKPFVKKNTPSLFKVAEEMIDTVMKKIGVYDYIRSVYYSMRRVILR